MDRNAIIEIEKLLSFLPKISAEDFHPVKQWLGDEEVEERTFTLPFPEYNYIVTEFIHVTAQEFWQAGYDPKEVRKILDNPEQIQSIGIEEIKSILTFFVRGERFCDGLIASAFEDGHIRLMLERLDEIRKTL